MSNFTSELPFSTYFLADRVRTLKLMHELVTMLDDEYFYYEMWIVVVPDEPDNSDFEFLAEDKERYEEVVNLFFEIMEKAKNGEAPEEY